MALASQLIRPPKRPGLAGVAPLPLAEDDQMLKVRPPLPGQVGGVAGSGAMQDRPINIAPPQQMEPQAPPPIAPPPVPAIAPPANGDAAMFTGADATAKQLKGQAPGSTGMPNIAPPVAPAPDDYMTDFGPGNDLQSAQINPTPTQRLQTAQQRTDAAQQGLTAQPGFTGFQGVSPSTAPGFNAIAPTPGFAPQADTARARELAAQGVEGLVGAPSRQDLALGTYDRLEQSTLADAKAAERQAFQRNAAGGRLGSGMLDEDVGDIFGQRKVALANARAGLASDSAGMELDDRLKKLSAVQNAGSQFEGQDLNRAGFDQGLRSEGRTERGQGLDYATGLRSEGREERATQRDFETGDLNRARNLLSDQLGIEQQQIGNERANRDEIRGERGFQTDRSDKALQDRIQQKMLEDSLTNSQFGRDFSTSQFENNQANIGQDNADASGDASAELIQEIMRSPEGQGLTPEDIRRLLQGG